MASQTAGMNVTETSSVVESQRTIMWILVGFSGMAPLLVAHTHTTAVIMNLNSNNSRNVLPPGFGGFNWAAETTKTIMLLRNWKHLSEHAVAILRPSSIDRATVAVKRTFKNRGHFDSWLLSGSMSRLNRASLMSTRRASRNRTRWSVANKDQNRCSVSLNVIIESNGSSPKRIKCRINYSDNKKKYLN